jgi:hypothetical protein
MSEQQTVVAMRGTTVEVVLYGFECPTCGDWHEHDASLVGKPPFECFCGTLIKVTAYDAA